MIVVKIKPSRQRVILMVALHVAAAFSFVFGLEAGLAGWLLVAVLAVSLFRCILTGRRGLPMVLGLKDDGGVLFQPEGSAEAEAVPDGASVVLAQVLWLVWRAPQGGRRGVLLLLQDQLTPHDWRRLQIWARLRTRPGLAAGSEPGA